jgi:regulatory protein
MDKIDKLTAKALKLLSYRPRSIFEIKIRLKKITDSEKLINQVIDNLIDQDLLDDQKFVQWWIDQRCTHRPKGNLALKSELFQKGIDRNMIESLLLSPQQERKTAVKLLKSRSIKNKSQAYQYLRTRGFTSPAIHSAIDGLSLKG